MAKSRKGKRYNPRKRASQSFTGLVISWEDDTPEDEHSLQNHVITHTNPLLRTVARDIAEKGLDVLYEHLPMLWRIEVTGIFEYDNGRNQEESRELIAFCVLNQTVQAVDDQMTSIMRHGNKDKFSRYKFRVECLGNRPAKGSDFEYDEAV